ncbi:MAG: sterol desaturase family protein [Arenicella sp.]|nr:sterol desaturase family protein [Arenicella sp.]
MNLILIAVPFFFALILIELAYGKIKGTDYYRVNDGLTSLATGSINQLVNLSKSLIPFTVYVAIHQHYALFDLGDSALIWVIAFVAYDFCYYWNHRFGHEMNLLWAAHVIHHSSEEYNLTTALRQTGSSFLSFIFYLPLALLGFDPLIIIAVGALNLIYQFWVHTRHVGKLGWFELFFVTPSNHRGHHAQNTVYIDRNYGGVFIIWDRLFGSYQEELEHDKPIFGIRGAVKSWNPIVVNLQVYRQLFQDALHTKSWWHKLTLWFRRTGWRPPDVIDAYPIAKSDDLSNFKKYQTEVPNALKAHCIIQYVATVAIALALSLNFSSMSLLEHMVIVAFAIISSVSIGALMENQHYAGVLEWLRLTILVIAATLFPLPQALSIFLVVCVLVCTPLLWIGRSRALQLAV